MEWIGRPDGVVGMHAGSRCMEAAAPGACTSSRAGRASSRACDHESERGMEQIGEGPHPAGWTLGCHSFVGHRQMRRLQAAARNCTLQHPVAGGGTVWLCALRVHAGRCTQCTVPKPAGPHLCHVCCAPCRNVRALAPTVSMRAPQVTGETRPRRERVMYIYQDMVRWLLATLLLLVPT